MVAIVVVVAFVAVVVVVVAAVDAESFAPDSIAAPEALFVCLAKRVVASAAGLMLSLLWKQVLSLRLRLLLLA
jgi:hypothetical protein